MQPTAEVTAAFGLQGGECEAVGDGSSLVWRCGEVVLKRLTASSLEHHDSLTIYPWLAELLAALPQDGFRVPVPLRAADGGWMTEEGWIAVTWLDGHAATAADADACWSALDAFHNALADADAPPIVRDNRSIFGIADAMAWGDPPATLHPMLAQPVKRLYSLRKPLGRRLPDQVIQGDPNLRNFVVSPYAAPGLLDISPLVRPAASSAAMFSLWAGPRVAAPLRIVDADAHWDQLLVRAALRMLLVVQLGNGANQITTELDAAHAVIAAVEAAA